MNKYKSFLLFLFYEGETGNSYEIRTKVLANGTFLQKGDIQIQNMRLKTAKNNAKKRGMGFNLLSLVHENCGFHHINRNDVVSIPLNIHLECSHNHLDGTALRMEGVLG